MTITNFADRCRQQSTSTGTGALLLSPPPLGYQAIGDKYADDVDFAYVVEGRTVGGSQTGQWEVGRGHLSSGSLIRDFVFDSSAGGGPVNFSSAVLVVFVAASADGLLEWLQYHMKTSSGSAGDVQLSDGSGGFTSDSGLSWTGTSLDVDGDVTATGNLRAQGYVETGEIATPATPPAGVGRFYFKSDGKPYAQHGTSEYDLTEQGVTSAAGNDTEIQFNSGGNFAGDENLTWSGTVLGVNGVIHVSDGTFDDPSLSFLSSPSTGLFLPSPDVLGVTVSGAEVARFSGSVVAVNANGDDIDFIASASTKPALFSVDAGLGRVGINRSAGTHAATLDLDNLDSAEPPLYVRDDGTVMFAILDGGAIELTELADSPALPAAGFGRVYAKDGVLYYANDTDEFDLTATGSIGGSIAADQIAFGTGVDAIGGSNDLTWNGYSFVINDGEIFVRTQTTLGGIGIKQDSAAWPARLWMRNNANHDLTLYLYSDAAADPELTELSAPANFKLTATSVDLLGSFVLNSDHMALIEADPTGLGAKPGYGVFYVSDLDHLPYFIDDSGGVHALVGGGGTIGGSIAAGQIAFGTDVNEIGGSGDLTWDSTLHQINLVSVAAEDGITGLVVTDFSTQSLTLAIHGADHAPFIGATARMRMQGPVWIQSDTGGSVNQVIVWVYDGATLQPDVVFDPGAAFRLRPVSAPDEHALYGTIYVDSGDGMPYYIAQNGDDYPLVGLGGSVTNGQIAFGSSTNDITSSADLVWDAGSRSLTVYSDNSDEAVTSIHLGQTFDNKFFSFVLGGSASILGSQALILSNTDFLRVQAANHLRLGVGNDTPIVVVDALSLQIKETDTPPTIFDTTYGAFFVDSADGFPYFRDRNDDIHALIGGGGIGGSIAAGQVAFGTDVDEIGGSDDLTYDGYTLSLRDNETGSDVLPGQVDAFTNMDEYADSYAWLSASTFTLDPEFASRTEAYLIAYTPAATNSDAGVARAGSAQVFLRGMNTGVNAIHSLTATHLAITHGGVEGARLASGAWTFNNGAADLDLRIKSQGDAALFFADAALNRLGFGTDTPARFIHASKNHNGDTDLLLTNTTSGGSSRTFISIGSDTSTPLGGNNLALIHHGVGFSASGLHVARSSMILSADTGPLVISGRNGDIILARGISTDANTERFRIATSSVVVNEQGQNIDFRVEGTSNANLLFVDADVNRIGVGINNPGDVFEVNQTLTGTMAIKARNQSTGTGASAAVVVQNSAATGFGMFRATSTGFTTSGVTLANQLSWFSSTGLTNGMLFATDSGGTVSDARAPMVFAVGSATGTPTANEKLRITQTAVIVNDNTQATADFRVAGQNRTHLIFTDANAGVASHLGRAGVNRSTLSATFSIDNGAAAEDIFYVYDNDNIVFRVNDGGDTVIAPVVRTTGAPSLLTVTGPAHTTLTASAEIVDVNINLGRTVQRGSGAVTNQRAVLIQAPTYSFTGASTIDNAATLAITGAPAAGANATITNRSALWVQSGIARFDGRVGIGTPAPAATLSVDNGANAEDIFYAYDNNTLVFQIKDEGRFAFSPKPVSNGAPADFVYTAPTHTGLTAGTEVVDVNFALARGVEHATGNIALQRSFVIGGVSHAFVAASTITTAITLFVQPPVASTNATITNNWAIYTTGAVHGGALVVDGALANDNKPALAILPNPRTGLTASTERPVVSILAPTSTWATGDLAEQRDIVFLQATYNFAGASTVTEAATVAIVSAPVAGTNATITTPHALWVQAGDTRLAGSLSLAITEVDDDVTLNDSHHTVLVDSSSGNPTISLPSAAGRVGRVYIIKKIVAANSVTIDTSGGQTIDGAASVVITDLNVAITVQSDGSNWYIT